MEMFLRPKCIRYYWKIFRFSIKLYSEVDFRIEFLVWNDIPLHVLILQFDLRKLSFRQKQITKRQRTCSFSWNWKKKIESDMTRKKISFTSFQALYAKKVESVMKEIIKMRFTYFMGEGFLNS